MTAPRYDVAIVGGGFAGLSAATDLAERGRRVIVLEARPRLGGRAGSFTDPATGERVDNGQHLLIGGYVETFSFLRRIGSEDAVYLQPRLSVEFIDRQGARSVLQSAALPAPFHLLGGILRWSALSWTDRVAALRMGNAIAAARPSRTKGSREGALHASLHGVSTVRDWLMRNGQTPRLIELLWEPLAVATLNEPIDVAAPAPFLHVLSRMFGAGKSDAALGLPVKPLEDMYAEPARRYLESRGGIVQVNASARLDPLHGLTVTVRDRPVWCRSVICAVPWFALSETIVPAGPLAAVIDAARATPASPIVTVNVWFDRPVMDGAFMGLPGRAMQWMFDKRLLFGEQASHLAMVSSAASGLVDRSNSEIVDAALSEVRGALPPARDAIVRRAIAVRERTATFSMAYGLPPRPGVSTPVPGLFLAGDWIDTGLPATIESAVVSGHRAAAAADTFLSQ